MNLDTILMTPGPVALDSDVNLAGAKPLRHHRTSDFVPIYSECVELLKKFFFTRQHLYLSTCSGTGVMEMALANLFHSGEKVLTVETGSFGERFSAIGRALRLNVIPLSYPWGYRAKVEDIARMLDQHPDIKGVTVTFNETSTGVYNNLEPIGRLLHDRNVLFVTDGVSGIGALPFRMDDWYLDCAVSASQKGFLAPPGIGMIALSEKALSKALQVEVPGLYFSVREAKRSQDENMPGFPWTPAISVMSALHTSLKKIEKVGIAVMHEHFHRLASALRAALKALNLDLFTQPDALSDVLTVIKTPENIHPRLIVNELRNRYGILIAGGQGKIADNVFRITTIGAIGERDLIATVGLLELVLMKLGVRPDVGRGVTAMLNAFAAQDIGQIEERQEE